MSEPSLPSLRRDYSLLQKNPPRGGDTAMKVGGDCRDPKKKRGGTSLEKTRGAGRRRGLCWDRE